MARLRMLVGEGRGDAFRFPEEAAPKAIGPYAWTSGPESWKRIRHYPVRSLSGATQTASKPQTAGQGRQCRADSRSRDSALPAPRRFCGTYRRGPGEDVHEPSHVIRAVGRKGRPLPFLFTEESNPAVRLHEPDLVGAGLAVEGSFVRHLLRGVRFAKNFYAYLRG